MQWFRLTVENQRNVTKFQKALSFLAESREYHNTYIYKLVKSTTYTYNASYAHNFCRKGVKKYITHLHKLQSS